MAGLLFRIDNEVMTGMTKPSKTSSLRTWNIPSGSKVNVEPGKPSDMFFISQNIQIRLNEILLKRKKSNLSFSSTLYEEHLSKLWDKNSLREKLYRIIKDGIAHCRFSEFMEKSY